MSPALNLTRRIVQLLAGLFAYGIAISLMVQAGIGVAPWDVLSQGLSKLTGIDFGLMTNIIGAFVLLLWIPIRVRPGLGTLANVALIGPSAQLGLWIFPRQHVLGLQLVFFTIGLVLLALATGLYIGARMGPGPRRPHDGHPWAHRLETLAGSHRDRGDSAARRLGARRQLRSWHDCIRGAGGAHGFRDDPVAPRAASAPFGHASDCRSSRANPRLIRVSVHPQRL